jgi:hypothetical protein
VAEALGQFGNPEEEKTPSVGSCYLTTDKETADREESLRVEVKWRMCELAIES